MLEHHTIQSNSSGCSSILPYRIYLVSLKYTYFEATWGKWDYLAQDPDYSRFPTPSSQNYSPYPQSPVFPIVDSQVPKKHKFCLDARDASRDGFCLRKLEKSLIPS